MKIGREDRFDDMVAFRDVHAPEVENALPLHFLPSCIGCSKRWACYAAKEEKIPAARTDPAATDRVLEKTEIMPHA